jgi:hypothetical protein
MNNYVLARNALIASVFLMLFMLSLQPQRISSLLMNIGDTVTNTFIDKRQINAAEKQANNSQLSLKLDSIEIILPNSEDLSLEEKGNAVLIKNDGESYFVITLEDYQGDLQQKAITLARKLSDYPANQDITVQPVMRGSNMYVEVSSLLDNERKVNYALKRINDQQIVVIVPSPDAEGVTINGILSEIIFKI